MKKIRDLLLFALCAVILASCASEQKDEQNGSLPEFEELTFKTPSDSNFNINIVYQHIVNTAESDIFAAIEESNLELTLPREESDVEADADFEERAEALLQTIIDDGFDAYDLDLVQTAFLTRNNATLCYATSCYTYMGGAHGYGTLHYTCYDLASGQMYDFRYLNEGEWDTELRMLIYNKLREVYSESELFITPDKIYVPESVLLTDVGLLLIYQPYEIAPYSTGIVQVELTDEDIAATGAPLLWVAEAE